MNTLKDRAKAVASNQQAMLLFVLLAMVAFFKPSHAPALPLEARSLTGSKLLIRSLLVLVPPLFLIFLVLGTIFIGIATPTEGGGMGALGAMILAISNRRLSKDLLKQAMNSTTRLSCFVLFILIGVWMWSSGFGVIRARVEAFRKGWNLSK